MEWVTILAIVTAPLVAVHVQRRLDELRQRRDRRMQVFKTLMATRAGDPRISPAHVQALNVIDVEFASEWSDTRKQSLSVVIDAWKEYLDHLNTPADADESWVVRNNDLFIDMLHKMAVSLGYKFDKVLLKKGLYMPRAYDQQSFFNRLARLRTWEMLDGRRPFPICIMDPPTSQDVNDDSAEPKPAG